jgi:hypothetical protein
MFLVLTLHHPGQKPPESFVIPPGLGQDAKRVECMVDFARRHWDDTFDHSWSDHATDKDAMLFFFSDPHDEGGGGDWDIQWIPGWGEPSGHTIPEMPY